jgi:hypothetical protein
MVVVSIIAVSDLPSCDYVWPLATAIAHMSVLGGRPMSIQIEPDFHAPTSTATFLIWDEATCEAAAIDAVLDYERAARHLLAEQRQG